MEDEDFVPDLNSMLEVSLVEGNAPSSNSEETETQVVEENTVDKTEDDTKEPKESQDESPANETAASSPQQPLAPPPPAAVEEPVQNGTNLVQQFKTEPVDTSELQKELYNFKVSLLPKDISEEERNHYLTAIEDIKSVTCMRLHCTVCNDHIGCQPEAEENTFSHINFHVLLCKQCYEFYGNGDFTIGADGSETYCFWCGQGGQVLCCNRCTHVFCKKCIRLNFGRKAQREIENSNDWLCFACNPKTLWDFKAQCWGLLTFNEIRRNNLISFTAEEELRLPGYNIAECCTVQRRAGNPLKLISYRFMIPRKKQENKEKATEVKNNKNKPITSNGKITYPAKILPKVLVAEGDPVIPSPKEVTSNPPTKSTPVPIKPKVVPTKLTPVPVKLTPASANLTPVPTKLTSALTVKTPRAVNAILSSPVSPQPHPTSDIIVSASVSRGINASNCSNYVNTTVSGDLRNNEAIVQRRTTVQRRAGSNYMLISTQSGNSTLVPANAIRSVVHTPMPASREVKRTLCAAQPVTYDIDDDDDVIIIDDVFDDGVKKLSLEWLVKSLDQVEKVSKTFQRQCENIKQSFMSEVKSNKIDAKRIRAFSGKMHNSLKRTAVKLACLDDKYITKGFSDWLKSEKLKHQKPPPPPEPAPKPDADLCLDMEIDCESDNEEDDDFETVFKNSVLDCPEEVSDVEFEDDDLNNITSSTQRNLLASLKQQTSTPKKQQCDMCIQTDQTEIEDCTSIKDEWTGAFSDSLTNRSVPDTSKQNGASSLNNDKANVKDESASSSDIEVLYTNRASCATILPRGRPDFKEKSTLPSKNEVSDPLIETTLCDMANIEEKSLPPSENDVSDPLIEMALCDVTNVEVKSLPPSENDVSDPLIEAALCVKTSAEEKSLLPPKNEASDPLIKIEICDNANTKKKSSLLSESDISKSVKKEKPCDKLDTEDKSPLPSENESSNPVIEAQHQQMPEVRRSGRSLKRACSSSPTVDSKKRRLESSPPTIGDEDKYKRYGLKVCSIKLTDIEIKTEPE